MPPLTDGTPALFLSMQKNGLAETAKAYGGLLALIPEMSEKERLSSSSQKTSMALVDFA